MARTRRFRRKTTRRPRRVRRIRRALRATMPYYITTETWKHTQVQVAAGIQGGVFSLAGNEVPQIGDYSALYRQFKIMRVTWMLVPRIGPVDPNTALYNQNVALTGVAYQGRFVYAINNTGGILPPATEDELLEDNGVKILSTARVTPIRITHVPLPLMNVSNSALSSVFVNRKKQWLNTNSLGNTGNGLGVEHYGVSWFCTIPSVSLPNPFIVFDVFCKATLQFRDPA